MWFVRVAIVILVLAAIGIAVVPILVMVDLLGGGTGWGLCPGGLESCDNPYTTPFELLILLAVSLFVVILAIRVVMKLARRLQAESFQVNAPESPPRPE
jgi:hypothetical protein